MSIQKSLHEAFFNAYGEGKLSKATQNTFFKNFMIVDKDFEAEPEKYIAVLKEIAKNNLNENTVDCVFEAIGVIIDYLYLPRPQYMDVLFFPNDSNIDKLIKYLELAKSTIDVCVFCITNNKLSNTLFYLHKIAGVKVRIISDDMTSENKGSDCQELSDTGIPVRLDSDPKAHMHNKFAVIDNRILINGSFNWTVQAVESNQENLIVLDSPELSEVFTKEFNKLWEQFKNHQLKKNEADVPYRFRKIEEKFSGNSHNPNVRKFRGKKRTKELYHVDHNPYQDDEREYGDGWF